MVIGIPACILCIAWKSEVRPTNKVVGWLVFWMIRRFRIPDPTKGQNVVGLDFLSIYIYIGIVHPTKKNICTWVHVWWWYFRTCAETILSTIKLGILNNNPVAAARASWTSLFWNSSLMKFVPAPGTLCEGKAEGFHHRFDGIQWWHFWCLSGVNKNAGIEQDFQSSDIHDDFLCHDCHDPTKLSQSVAVDPSRCNPTNQLNKVV